MKLTAKARANRLNAKRSTGPRTAAGKARVARNALSHGLSIPIVQTPDLEARVEDMAFAIAGKGVDVDRLELARRIAEAQLDLVRIRDVRRRLLDDPMAHQNVFSTRELIRNAKKLMRWGDKLAAVAKSDLEYEVAIREVNQQMERLISGTARESDPPSLVEGLGNLAQQLLRIERYERRAVSSRKAAMRAYDSYCADQVSCGQGIKPVSAAHNAKGAPRGGSPRSRGL